MGGQLIWKIGRVVEGARLEHVYSSKANLGFESLIFRVVLFFYYFSMWVLEESISKKLDEKKLIDEIRDDPEKLWEFIKQFIDKFVEKNDIKALQMLYDFIWKNMENSIFQLEHSDSQLKVRAMLEEKLGKNLSN